MKTEATMQLLKQLAKGIAEQFGKNCEVVVHDLMGNNTESTIVAIENGHVTKRHIGDTPSPVVLEALKHQESVTDRLSYLTTTEEGRILRSSTFYIRDEKQTLIGIFAINFDITHLMMAESTLHQLTQGALEDKQPEKIPTTVEHLLEDLIERSVKLVGKPVAMMTKEDKMCALQFLNDSGAFMITKSGDKISEYFGISKYTLYNYIDIKGNKS